MSRNLWFALGFAAAWLVVAALLVLPATHTEAARAWLEGPGRPTVPAAPLPTATPTLEEPGTTETAAPQPTATWLAAPGLAWTSQGRVAGACARLEIDPRREARYAPCGQGLRLALLTEPELRAYARWVEQLAPFVYAVQRDTGQVGMIRLSFTGQGPTQASVDEQAALAAWAEAVYTRLYEQEVAEDLVAQARLLLAGTLEQPIEAIETVSVAAETWPDACLGLAQVGVDCAAVSTPGYRIRLAVAGVQYEVHTDLRGTVRLMPPLEAH
ncbi:MAG: hypothetical protein GX605_02805 [Chloroflexi bacterium]|nr:hypothetical protein [Chloroflexota bacterium]